MEANYSWQYVIPINFPRSVTLIHSGIPHETTEDDVYEGYFIPKGTFIHPNQWAITRDKNIYPDPHSFNPARWLEPLYLSYREPLTKFPTLQNFTTFGYGCRMCMGMDLIENEFFVAIGAMAWAITVRKLKDANGREIDVPSHDYSTYLISRPRKLHLDLRVRSDEKRVLMQEFQRAAAKQLESL
jgi:cytochrome P450